MLRISEFPILNEGRYQNWLRVGVAVIVMKIRKLTTDIENETDSIKQKALTAQQNRLLS